MLIENSRNNVFKNTFKDIETILKIGNDNNTRVKFECYDISHLYNLAHFVDLRHHHEGGAAGWSRCGQ